MGATEKYSRYRWKEGREKDLWTFVDGKVKDGVSVTAALKEYGKRHNMSWLTARWKYYQVRKREGVPAEGPTAGVELIAEPKVEVTPPIEPSGDDDFIECLTEFVSMSRESGEDVMTLMRGLARMASMSRESSRMVRDREIRIESQRQDALVVREVRGFLTEWLSLPQVDRVATLKGFSERLSALADRLGEVEERLAAQA